MNAAARRIRIATEKGAALVNLETKLGGNRQTTFYATPVITPVAFEIRVEERWNAIKDLKNDGPIVFDKPSERFEAMPDGIVMTFQHHTMDLGSWPDGTSGPQSFYQTEGYLLRDNTLYKFEAGSSKETVINAMQALQVRRDDEVPTSKGFCGSRSFFGAIGTL